MNFKLEQKEFRPFDVARIHGVNGLRHLSSALDKSQNWEALNRELKQKDETDLYISGGLEISKKRMQEEVVAHHLFASIILFQASMESVLTMTSNMDDRVLQAKENNNSFASKWKGALGNVGEGTSNFERYESEIYVRYRNPLSHLGTEDDIKKINEISFEGVYCGIRCGWWAYSQLLHGIEKHSGNYYESWKTICDMTNLKPDLYPEDGTLKDA